MKSHFSWIQIMHEKLEDLNLSQLNHHLAMRTHKNL